MLVEFDVKKLKMKVPKLVKKDTYLMNFAEKICERIDYSIKKEKELTAGGDLNSFANAHLFFGLHKDGENFVYRDWLPEAEEVYLTGDFAGWKALSENKLTRQKDGVFIGSISGSKLKHRHLYKLIIKHKGEFYERIPAYATRLIQDDNTKLFCAQVWFPEENYVFRNKSPKKKKSILIYEVHIGMASQEEKVATFNEFTENILPEIAKTSYDTIQLMAIQEHPYYGSFGYHVSSFFACSSRFGTPEDLKRLIDTAHGYGIRVIMDIVHSHAVKNELEGLSKYDGSDFLYFHTGAKGEHPAWDSRCFNYGKNEVLHFLLSNCKFWLQEYNFDGFRFDGVTSMLYLNHGLGQDFNGYADYFGENTDLEACAYLELANKLIHEIKPDAVTIAEDMSGMPGLATTQNEGGFGFDFRLAMGVPDFIIKIVKEIPDENWHVGEIFYRLTDKRDDEKVISYVESHDQALVGDKTLIMRLADREIYFSMAKDKVNLVVDRALSLHKIIRLLTISTAGNGYLNFMGNEFAHPEWIDFPREGNNWSHKYARRQWNLRDDNFLVYRYMYEFDKVMIEIISKNKVLEAAKPFAIVQHTYDQVLIFERAGLLFIFNINPLKSFEGYEFQTEKGEYKVVLNSDSKDYFGHDRIDDKMTYTTFEKDNLNFLKLYIPNRCCFVLKRV